MPGKTELGDDISWEVVGVIGDEKIGGPEDTRSAGVYVSNEQSPVYGHGPEHPGEREPAHAPDADHRRDSQRQQGSGDQRRPDAWIKSGIMAMGGRRLVSVLLGTFATVALVLAGIGIYGVISYNVAQRTREMGIRAALGATERSLLRLILDRGVRLTLIGLAIGVAGAIGSDPADGDAACSASARAIP